VLRPRGGGADDEWKPEEVTAHIGFMEHVADVLRDRGEYVDGQALSPDGLLVLGARPGW